MCGFVDQLTEHQYRGSLFVTSPCICMINPYIFIFIIQLKVLTTGKIDSNLWKYKVCYVKFIFAMSCKISYTYFSLKLHVPIAVLVPAKMSEE